MTADISSTVTVTVTASSGNYTGSISATSATAAKADAFTLTHDIYLVSGNTTAQTLDVSAVSGKPSGITGVAYTFGATTNAGGVLNGNPTFTSPTLTYTGAGKSTGTATQVINITSANYADSTITITFTAAAFTPQSITASTYSNTAVIGTELESTDGTYMANDGGTEQTHSYQWKRSDNNDRSNAANLAITKDYTPTGADFGKYIWLETTPNGSEGLTGTAVQGAVVQVGVKLTVTVTGAGGGTSLLINSGAAGTGVIVYGQADISFTKTAVSDTVAWTATPNEGSFSDAAAASTTYIPATAPSAGTIALAATLTKAKLTQPTGVAVSNTGNVSWNSVSNAASYTIKVYTSGGSVAAAITGKTGASYQLANTDGLTAGTGYYVKVTAIGSGAYTDSNESAQSAGTFNVYSVVLTTSGYASGDSVSLGVTTVTSDTTTTVYAIHDSTVAFTASAGAGRIFSVTGDVTVSGDITNITANKVFTAAFAANTAPTINGQTNGTDTIDLTEGYSAYTKLYTIAGTPAPTIGVNVGNTAGATITGDTLTIPAGLTAAGSPYAVTITAANAGGSATMTVTVNVTAVPVITVKFNANGGSVSPSAMQAGTDGKLAYLPTPARSGSYSFDGWYTAAGGGTRITVSYVFTANKTVYAHWIYTGGIGGGSSGGGGSNNDSGSSNNNGSNNNGGSNDGGSNDGGNSGVVGNGAEAPSSGNSRSDNAPLQTPSGSAPTPSGPDNAPASEPSAPAPAGTGAEPASAVPVIPSETIRETKAYEYGGGVLTLTIVKRDGQDSIAAVKDTNVTVHAILTDEELARVAAGEDLEIMIDFRHMHEEQEVPESDKAGIEDSINKFATQIEGLQMGKYIDIAMQYRVGGGEWLAVTETTEEIELVIDIPDDLRADNATYFILRCHEGYTVLLRDLDSDPATITVKTKLFSTYAIVYTLQEVTPEAIQAAEEMNTEQHKCRLCGFCPEPFGVCILIWLLSVITAGMVIYFILKRKKKQDR